MNYTTGCAYCGRPGLVERGYRTCDVCRLRGLVTRRRRRDPGRMVEIVHPRRREH